MPKVSLLLLQAATSVAPSAVAPGDRLLHPVEPSTCRPSANEIVVCGKDSDAYRLPKAGPLPDDPMLPKAEWKLFGNSTMTMHGEQRSLPRGASAPAAMVTIKIPF